MSRKVITLLSLMLIGALLLVACGGDEVEEVATQVQETVEEVATQAPEIVAEVEEAATEVAEVMEEPTEEPTPEPVEEAAEEPELTLTIWADDTRAPLLSSLVDEFGATYGVNLVVEFVDVNNQLPISAPAGEGPDLFVTAHDRAGGFVDSGLVAPVELGDKVDLFTEVSLNAFTFGGVLYGMPYAIENMALFRNADLVPEAPETWDELLAAGKALQESGDVTYAFVLENNGYKIYPLLTSFGGYVFGRDEVGDWDPSDIGIDNEGMIAAGNWIVENVNAGLLSPNANSDDVAQALFVDGETPFIMTGPWAIEQFQEAGVNYAISPFPDGGQPFAGVQGFMINAFSENILLAQAFLTEFIATEDIMTFLQEEGNRASTYLPVVEQTDDPDLAALGEAGSEAVVQPAIPEMGAVWGAWNGAVELVINGGDTPESAFGTAAQQIRDTLAGVRPEITEVNVPGSYQVLVGCESDWNPDCQQTELTEGDDGIWTGSFELPAGDYEAKAALNGAWDYNYGVGGEAGGDNFAFSLDADGTVTFAFDPETNVLEITIG